MSALILPNLMIDYVRHSAHRLGAMLETLRVFQNPGRSSDQLPVYPVSGPATITSKWIHQTR